MSFNEQLYPPRPSREELFLIANRYLTTPAPQPANMDVFDAELKASVTTGPAQLCGAVWLMCRDSIRERRRESARQKDIASLMAEQACRDLDPYASIDELARSIVTK